TFGTYKPGLLVDPARSYAGPGAPSGAPHGIPPRDALDWKTAEPRLNRAFADRQPQPGRLP
ncbi:hypothetical protein, partial [Streptomyces venezuelae]|uniref:hypothetical protein n=1 Tax=Streptomyces venezuelae TaxID=54571 RepID=UPI00343AE41C